MLGVASKSSYKNISDFKSSADYLRYLFAGANGHASDVLKMIPLNNIITVSVLRFLT